MTKIRPCERQCKACGEWKHYSRFHAWRDKRRSNATVAVQFSPNCRDCEQKARNEKKNADRPKAIIESRAKTAAGKAGKSLEFFWTSMNYRALVPYLRAMMTPEGLCQNCGHRFVNERDIQIDHIEPPRFETDWARLHARNLTLRCGSCNNTKGNKSFSDWLDEQEGTRLSHLNKSDAGVNPAVELWKQQDLFVF
jgi:hypothetical protein